jgi:phage tail-like protein
MSDTNAGLEPESSGPTQVTADWSNAGVGDESSGPTTLTADWSNVGLRDESPGSTTLTANWSNAGLGQMSPGSTALMTPASQAGVGLNTAVGVSVFFTVTLDVVDLGYWTKVNGLGMSISTTDRGDTAMSFVQHHLPSHLVYDKITLERPVSASSANIMNWFSAYHMLPIPTAGQICCVDQTGAVLMTWDMLGITPVTWKGPDFDANQHSVATEKLTIHHMGFM